MQHRATRSPPCTATPRGKEERHSHHEEDASSVGEAASFGWGGTLVVAADAAQQAQAVENDDEGQQPADNQAPQPPGEASSESCCVRLVTQKLSDKGWRGWVLLGNQIQIPPLIPQRVILSLPILSSPTQPTGHLILILALKRSHPVVTGSCFLPLLHFQGA